MALPSSPPDPPPPTATTMAVIAATTTGASTAAVITSSAAASTRFLSSPPPTREHSRPPTSPIPQSQQHHHHHYQPPSQTHPLYAAQTFTNLVPRVHTSTNTIHAQFAPRQPLHHDLTQTQGLLYPVASSGRGFLQKAVPPQQAGDQTGGFLSRPVVAAYTHSVRPYGHTHSDPSQAQGQVLHLIRPTHLQQSHLGSSGNVMPGVVKGIPVSAHHPTVANSPPVSDCNGFKDSSRERRRDDNFTTVRDRKVRISETPSLYALCRSWIRNGFHEETQPQYMDGVKSLPRPVPVPLEETYSPVQKESDKDEEEEVVVSIEQLSEQDLLQRHIKHAKKVRAQLRKERLRRIARYKTRLALLLPPNAEQQLRHETVSGD